MAAAPISATAVPGGASAPPHAHDHGMCVSGAVAAAEQLAAEAGAKLTPLRRSVLEIVWSSHAASGAYEILAELRARAGKGGGPGANATPITVYRALEFLLSLGLVHRLESINAFIGCPCPGEAHRGVFLICRSCRSVVELHDEAGAGVEPLVACAAATGFTPERLMVELSGLCAACAGTTAHAHINVTAATTE